MKYLPSFVLIIALCAGAQGAWYWPFSSDDEKKPPRISELMEPASVMIDEAYDLAADGKTSDAFENFRAALEELDRIEKYAVPQLFALDPHKLMRGVEVLNLLENARIIIYAQRERKLSSPLIGMQRQDYREPDEEELNNYLVLHQEDGEVKFERLPIRFWGNMKEQYEAHNQDYTGVYKG